MNVFALPGRLRGLERRLSAVSWKHRQRRAVLALRLLALYRLRGFRPVEALQLDLLDPALTQEQLDACFTKQELMALQDRLNPRSLVSLTEDKAVFAARCDELALPAPRTFAEVGRTLGGPFATGPDEFLARVVPALPSTFITKPSLGVYGAGVERWTRVPSGFADHRGRTMSAQGLLASLGPGPNAYDRFLVQECLENHPELVALTGATALQTARVATLVDGAGDVHVLYAEWKLAVGDSVVDNFKQGTSGNLVANLELSTGALGPAKRPGPDGVGMEAVEQHPKTGRRLPLTRLPQWDHVLALVRRCALSFAPLRTVGWDIGLTPDGPRVVEGNRWWDPPNDAVLGPGVPGLARHEMLDGARLLRQEAALAR